MNLIKMLLIFLCSVSVLFGDVIILESGKTINCEIISEDSDIITVKDSDGIVQKIPKHIIVEISRGEAVKIHSLSQSRKPTNQYYSVSLGYGNSFGGFGISSQRRNGFISYHTGIGYFPFSSIAEMGEDIVMWEVGLKFFILNNLYIDLQFGDLGAECFETYDWYGDVIESTQYTLWGPSILVGADLFVNDSFGFILAFGVSKNMVETELLSEYMGAIDLGIIFKL